MRLSGTRWLRALRFSSALLLALPTLACVSATSYDEVAEERDQLREEKDRDEAARQSAEQARIAAEGWRELGFAGRKKALLRWNSPEYGHISPGLFIPIAEESDLIADIGSMVVPP